MFQGLIIFLSLLIPLSLKASEALTIYAYDSFVSKGSLGELLKRTFEKKHSAKVNYVTFGSSGEALNQIALEGKNTKADILIGVDNSLLFRAKKTGAFRKFENKIVSNISADLHFDREFFFVPFDYGFVSIVYDSRRTGKLGNLSLKEFSQNKSFRKKLVIEDPRTSSLGLSFLVWTRLLFAGENFATFWKDLSQQILTISPGWSGAYGLFTKKEADFVVSYTTSPAYHIEHEKHEAIQAFAFTEGNYRQIEGVGITQRSPKSALAEKWVELLLSPEIQEKIPTAQWMYPALKGAPLPKSFSQLPRPSKIIDGDSELIESSKQDWLRQWTQMMAKAL